MSATYKMIEFAEKIAEELDLPEPDYEDFDETSEFIFVNKEDYFESLRDKRR